MSGGGRGLDPRFMQELKQKNGGSYHCPLPDYVPPPIGRY